MGTLPSLCFGVMHFLNGILSCKSIYRKKKVPKASLSLTSAKWDL